MDSIITRRETGSAAPGSDGGEELQQYGLDCHAALAMTRERNNGGGNETMTEGRN
jgi:hypothetical protein